MFFHLAKDKKQEGGGSSLWGKGHKKIEENSKHLETH